MAQTVKNLPAMQETQVHPLSQEDPLEKEMATHSSILAWRISGQKSLEGYSPQGRRESDITEQVKPSTESTGCLVPFHIWGSHLST